MTAAKQWKGFLSKYDESITAFPNLVQKLND
jgi:hypothetical protein